MTTARRRRVFREVRVAEVERLTTHLVRVVFEGESLQGYASTGPAEHIKVFFPADGQERPVMPVWTDDGPVYQEGVPRPVSRTYTPRRWDPAALRLTVDFLVHGEGVASAWAATATPGQVVVIAGPGGPYPIDQAASHYLLAAESCALPALQTILEALPPMATATAFVEVESAEDELPLESPATLDVTWLHRGTDIDVAGRHIEAAIRSAPLQADERIWVGCEAGVMRDIRRHLLQDRGLPRSRVYTHGYWKRGTPNHPDHDLGEDDE